MACVRLIAISSWSRSCLLPAMKPEQKTATTAIHHNSVLRENWGEAWVIPA